MDKKRVVILGAGPSGLAAAYELLNRAGSQYEVIILEQSDNVGGMQRTVTHQGNYMNLAGHRLHSEYSTVINWISNFLPKQSAPSFDDKKLGRDVMCDPDGKDPQTENNVLLCRRDYSSSIVKDHFIELPVSPSLSNTKSLGVLKNFKIKASLFHSKASKRRFGTLESYLINTYGLEFYSTVLERYIEKLWNKHPAEITAESVNFNLTDIMLSDFFTSEKISDNSRMYYTPKLGNGALWERVAAEIKKLGGKIITGCRVNGLVCKGLVVQTVDCTVAKEKRSLSADIFISTLPLKELINSFIGIAPPGDVMRIADGLVYRDLLILGLLVKKLKLKNNNPRLKTINNIPPDCSINVHDTSLMLSKINIYNNLSPYLAADPLKTTWLGLEYPCNKGDMFWNMSDNEFFAFAAGEAQRLGLISAPDVLGYKCERIEKAFPAPFGTYSEIERLTRYIDSFVNLYSIGRNGQHRCFYTDAAIITALAAVDNILSGKEDKSMIWECV